MDRKQVIEELKILIEAFKDERDAFPLCLEEAVRLLEGEDYVEVGVCKHCKDGECEIRAGIADDPSCKGTKEERRWCNYSDDDT